MTFANGLDPDQARQNVGPVHDPKCLTLMVFLEFFGKVDFKKIQQVTKKHEKFPRGQRVKLSRINAIRITGPI